MNRRADGCAFHRQGVVEARFGRGLGRTATEIVGVDDALMSFVHADLDARDGGALFVVVFDFKGIPAFLDADLGAALVEAVALPIIDEELALEPDPHAVVAIGADHVLLVSQETEIALPADAEVIGAGFGFGGARRVDVDR